MLELGKGDVVEELDQELARDILLVWREFFDGDENGGGSNNEDEQGMDVGCGEETGLNGDRAGQGRVGRFVKQSGWEVWHLYGGGFECWWR